MGEPVVAAGGTPPVVFLHIGTMKTGTSFLQTVLRRNARLLEEHGVRYPLAGGTKWALQVSAARDVLGIKGRPTDGAWDELVAQIHSWTGRATVVSMEFFSLAPAARVQKVVAGLAPSRVQVVITARDLVRVLPSAWQSMVKQGHQWSFPEFATAVVGSDGSNPAYRRFWRHSDVAAIAAKWAGEVGPDNVHVVTVPPPGSAPTVLWERFCSVIGVPAGLYDVSQDRNSNFSLGFSDSELLRAVHAELGGELDRVAQKRWATRYLANRVLRVGSAERTADDRPVLDAATYEWAVRRSEAMVAGVADLGVQVVGDLADLVPRPADAGVTDRYATPAVAYPERAAMIIAALVRRIAEVDPQVGTYPETELQDPDDAAELDEAMEALQLSAEDADLPITARLTGAAGPG